VPAIAALPFIFSGLKVRTAAGFDGWPAGCGRPGHAAATRERSIPAILLKLPPAHQPKDMARSLV
jgi:hypothetical protein